jgi:mannose-1-phosphate guanylyltransferase
MITQELLQPTYSAQVSRSSAPSITTTSTMSQIDTDWGRVSVRTKQYPQQSQSNKQGEAPKRQPDPAMPPRNRWGIVLAGGDGVRLRELTEWAWGDHRPKQFCPILSQRTLLEEARHRAERSVPPEHILYSVTRAHEEYYLPSLADRLSQTIAQPFNRGTAPAILSALIRIAHTDPNALVVVLPCDHYYSPESAFTATLESAFAIAEQRSHYVVLLGIEPKGPEVEYGWIEVGETIPGPSGLFQVGAFREKPPLPQAEALLRAGSLWNTLVMVGRVSAFLDIGRATVPGLLQVLDSWEVTISGGESRIPDAVYKRIASTDFSRQVLSAATDRLLALRLADVQWSDLGDPYRVLVTLLEKNGYLPSWAKLWPEESTSTRSASAATA